MSLTVKLPILGAVLLGELVAAAILARRMMAQEKFTQLTIILGGMAMAWIAFAVVLLAIV